MAARSAQSTARSWHRAQRAGAWALLLLAPAALVLRCATAPELPFLCEGPAAWIGPASVVSAELRQWGHVEVPEARFARRFDWRPGGAAVELRLRALRRFEVELNGAPLAAGDASRWRRETRIDLSPALRPGENRLVVAVRNPNGPPLLSALVTGLAEPIGTDASWSVAVDGLARPVEVADDTRINPHALAVETPLEALAGRRDAVLALFAAGGLGFLAVRRFGAPLAHFAPLALLGAAGAAWLQLFASKIVKIPLEIGFDARHHLAYLELLRQTGAVPLATDGWSTFHPPLFYLASLLAGASRTALRLLPWLAGFGSVLMAWLLARRLLPDDPRGVALAVLFAAVLPMNVYSSAYFSNESLHTLLASAVLVATVGELRSPRSEPGGVALTGALLGLAALTKFTVLLIAPVVLFFFALKWRAIDRAGVARMGRLALAFAAPCLAIAGWFYARNLAVYGDPLMANWGDMPGEGHTWWQQPGFHTAAYYLGFGQALTHPYLSGFHSFWDSVYSTFWGDGFVAGRVRPSDRHGFWSYEWMSAGYLLALPATALLVFGALRGVRVAFADADAGRRAAFSFLATCVWVVGLGFGYLTLRMPFFAQAKATYVLLLIGPLALFFGMGAGRCDAALAARGWTPARFALWGWLAAWAGSLHLAFAA